jgi:excisionase family DNA binding protein
MTLMQEVQTRESSPRRVLLTAEDVSQMLGIDVSTVYRMAADGRLEARKVGRQWRFAPEAVGVEGLDVPAMSHAIDPIAARAAITVAADLLGVMMVVTDLAGVPVTEVVNPCRRYADATSQERAACLDHWAELAATADLGCRFAPGPLGIDCASAFIRSGDRLLGMVLAGMSPDPVQVEAGARDRVVHALPRIAASLARP